MKTLKQQAGNKLAGVILDLATTRALLDQAVAVSDAFLERARSSRPRPASR